MGAPLRSYTFPKEEHLCRKKLIDELFSGQGSSFGVYPLRFIWLPAAAPIPTPPQVLVSVSKRTFKRAVDRNYLKRLLREAYRLNKYRLLEAPGGHPVAVLGLLYTGKAKMPLAIIEKRRAGNRDRTEVLNLIGSVDGKQAIIVDDEIDTAGSITQAADVCLEAGATEVYASAIHAVLSGPAVQRLQDCAIREVVITNSIAVPREKRFP
jgi:ribonuclease P protein component